MWQFKISNLGGGYWLNNDARHIASDGPLSTKDVNVTDATFRWYRSCLLIQSEMLRPLATDTSIVVDLRWPSRSRLAFRTAFAMVQIIVRDESSNHQLYPSDLCDG